MKTKTQPVPITANEILQTFGLFYSETLWDALDRWLPWHLWVHDHPRDEEALARRADLKTDVTFWLNARLLTAKGGAKAWVCLHSELGGAIQDWEPSEED